MLDALRGYVQLATGLTEVTVTKAREAASALISQGVPPVTDPDAAVDAAKVAATQVQGLADGLLEMSQQNREMLVGLVRTEVDRAAGRLGFVREEELAAVRRHVSRLESQLIDVRTRMGAADDAAPTEPEPAPPAAPGPEAAPGGPTPGIPVKRKKKVPVAPQEDA